MGQLIDPLEISILLSHVTDEEAETTEKLKSLAKVTKLVIHGLAHDTRYNFAPCHLRQ